MGAKWAVVQARGTFSSQGLGIAYEGAGGALVTGSFYREVSFGSTSLTSRGGYDAFVMHVAPSRYAMRDKGRKLPPSSSALLVGWGAIVLAVSGSVIGRGMRSGR